MRAPNNWTSSGGCACLTELSLVDELRAVHQVLEEAHVANALCGGMAANLYRTGVRATTDVDVYIACSAPELVRLAKAFEERGWAAHPAWRKAELLRLERDDKPKVDLLVAATQFERLAVERARQAQIEDLRIRVLRAEDLIVFKLVAGRVRDYADVAAIINAQTDRLDDIYIERSLREFDMDERWGRAVEMAVVDKDDID